MKNSGRENLWARKSEEMHVLESDIYVKGEKEKKQALFRIHG
jgi:hypothetical protein